MKDDFKDKGSIFLIDGSSYIYRAYYALPYLSNSEGVPTNAVYGFTKMLLKIIKEHRPEHIAVAFDTKGPTFRVDMYSEYKAQRPEMPDDLKPQIPYIKKIVRALNIPSLEKEGYEADDIIGTLADEMVKKGIEVVIVTGDKDMLQLVGEHITVLDTMKNRRFGCREVVERYGVGPQGVVEIMGLAGDSVDNIPGVPGIGEKTAIKLIKEFKNIEGVLDNIDGVPNRRVRENLSKFREQAILSRRLASIDRAVEIEYRFDDLVLSEPDYDKLKELFKELGFNKLIKEIMPSSNVRVDTDAYSEADSEEELEEILKAVREKGEVSLDTYLCGGNNETEEDACRFRGVALCFSNKKASFIILKDGAALNCLRSILEDSSIKKYGYDLKSSRVGLNGIGIELSGLAFDTMVASYLLSPQKAPFHMKDVFEEFVGRSPVASGKERGLSEVVESICDTALLNLHLTRELSKRLEEEALSELFTILEMPLVEVLASMELSGIKVDKDLLLSLSSELQSEADRLEEKIYTLGGGRFNINSPKQLQKILFKELGLKPVKKTKTGFSTDEEVLKKLSLQHELPMEILNYRHISKLKSTYVDALISIVDPETDRVHTSLNQATTSTGRLSSSEPNLQNIPIRSELGKRIREVFVAEKGSLLLSADYSQIELRIMAHLSHDPLLIDAFISEEDIHSKTASEVFHVLPGMVTEDLRREAKAINFGIIYGISPYGLAKNLDISTKEAGEYITKYFSLYKGVKEFIDTTLKNASKDGYVETMFGRKRPVPELKSRNPSVRAFGERIAVNTPIQGTAADIIKKAMIELYGVLQERRLKTKLALQIHDELLFEVPEDELDEVKTLVKDIMEGVVDLSVPIKVDVGIGKNWREAH